MHRSGRHHIGWREFSFSRRSPFSDCAQAHNADFCCKGNPYDNRIPARVQRRTNAPAKAFATETALLLARRLRRIMFLPRLSDPRGDAIMPAKKLTDSEVQKLLSKAKGWSVVNGKLHREFACKDFITAFGNMTRVALVAEAMNHHPEWFNVWNKVVIDLNTHSVSGISDYDFVLAEKINEIFGA
jgi:4a-hydroxytetrahydrobiopterin dehydratase